VLKIDTLGRRIQVRRLESGSEYWEPYHRLVIATGARPIRPEIPGIDAGGILTSSWIGNAPFLKKPYAG
jgi:pyruvate/2-oxoglutarate dehydrogenase complex dihydrolipoamide dehydrogenase (E3) component